MGGTRKAGDFLRLYMLPGVGHGGGGIGPGNSEVAFLTALEEWAENDLAPAKIVAKHYTGGEVDLSRPLCPFPQAAVRDGVGDPIEDPGLTCQDYRAGCISNQ
jgi:Tannase and feruloyl esterase